VKNDPHDPLAAVAESDAMGVTAELFADIRRTMDLPLVTSIWRILAGHGDALGRAWSTIRPLYEGGQVGPSWERLQRDLMLPAGSGAGHGQAAIEACHNRDGLLLALTLVRAYNRSNGLNFLALTALVEPPAAEQRRYSAAEPPGTWPAMPQLRQMDELSEPAQNAILAINELGHTSGSVVVATIWRHLGSEWPDLLPLAQQALSPLEGAGHFHDAVNSALHIARTEGARLATFLPHRPDYPPVVSAIVRDYVRDPKLVVRMVVVGLALERVLDAWAAGTATPTGTAP
jgi:hypothetical protein